MPIFRSRRSREPFSNPGDAVVEIPASHAVAAAARQDSLRQASHDMLQGAIAARGDALDAIREAEQAVHVAEQQLQDTTVVLAQAEEQILRIDDAADRIESTVERSRRYLADIVRGMCRDRCFIGLMVVMLIAVTAVGALFARDALQNNSAAGSSSGSGGSGGDSSTTVNVNSQTTTPAPAR